MTEGIVTKMRPFILMTNINDEKFIKKSKEKIIKTRKKN